MSKYGCKRKDADWVVTWPLEDGDCFELRGETGCQALILHLREFTDYLLCKIKDTHNDFPNIPWADGYGPKEPKYKEGDLVRHWSGARGVYCGEYAAGHRVRYFDGVERYYRTLDQLDPLDPDPDILAAYEAGKRCHE